jgi:hypothetical protein
MSVSLGFVAFPTELNTFCEAGLCTLVMINSDSVLPFLPETVSFMVSLGKIGLGLVVTHSGSGSPLALS